MVQAILHRLKTGCQWRELPMKEFFTTSYRWQAVYYHFKKWSKDSSWQRMWIVLLEKHKHLLDLSCIQLDGSHTPAKRGGEAVGYQGRKKSKTTNLLIISDNQGIPVACSDAVSGNHNDAFNLESTVDRMFQHMEASAISTQGLFLNADAGFDNKQMRCYCNRKEIIPNIDSNSRNGLLQPTIFDELLYKRRFVIERTNAWLDGFKALLVRFETKQIHWRALNILACIVILIRQL